MKKTLLATGILAAMMSTSSFAATVYKDGGTSFEVNGRAEARFNITDNDDDTDFTDKSRGRVSFVGQTDIAEGYNAFGKYELEVQDGQDSADLSTRYLYAGVGSEYGRFSYGQQDTIAVALTDMTDTMATFGGEANAKILRSVDAAGNVTNLGAEDVSEKVENNFAYTGTFDALTVGANYVVAEDDENEVTIGAAYAFDFGLTFGAGYFDKEDTIDGYMVAAQYGISDFTFGALYEALEDEGDTDYTGYEVSAQYDLDKFSFITTYNLAEQDPKGTSNSEDVVEALAVEGVYKFNRNFRTYVGYRFDLLDEDDAVEGQYFEGDQLQAGLRYDF